MHRRSALHAFAVAAASAAAAPLAAKPRPIRLVVPYPPGGPLDIVARALADQVRDSLGSVAVENRPGAGGNLGADQVAKSAPDGRLGIRGVADLVAYARRHPGRLNYGSGGNGSAGHLAGELFKSQAGVFMVHIPYAGGSPAQLALLSGQVDLNFDNLAAASANIRAGKLVAIAMTTGRRATAMPEVPTIAESGAAFGLASFDIDTWFGLFGPAAMPAELTQRLNAAFVDALNAAELRSRLATLLAEPMPSSPGQFAAFVKRELAKYRTVVKASGATVG